MEKDNSLLYLEVSSFGGITVKEQESSNVSTSSHCSDKEAGVATCRVCHCIESDKRGNVALAFLGVSPPLKDAQNSTPDTKSVCRAPSKDVLTDSSSSDGLKRSGIIEFISPNGEIFVCENENDIEMVLYNNEDKLLTLGCACKNDLALVHYACALKWFVHNGSTICEICGCVAENIRTVDVKKVLKSLKDYEALRERTINGEPIQAHVLEDSGVDPDALAAIRRQRLSEISLWFKPHDNSFYTVPEVVNEQPFISYNTANESSLNEHSVTRLSLLGSVILLAAGILTVSLAWIIAPRVGKKTARIVLHILLASMCALTVAMAIRFFVLTRMKYGSARYWAILFVFWFLVFAIWASRTHHSHGT